jgi:hypothetical protein
LSRSGPRHRWGNPGALYNDRTDDIYVHERGIIRTPVYDVLTPTKLDFGDRVLGTSVTRRVFLQNRTPSFLVVRDFTILGSDRQSFTEDDASGWYLMWPNDTLTVRVTFKASTLGPKSAYLRLPVDTNIDRRERARPIPARFPGGAEFNRGLRHQRDSRLDGAL